MTGSSRWCGTAEGSIRHAVLEEDSCRRCRSVVETSLREQPLQHARTMALEELARRRPWEFEQLAEQERDRTGLQVKVTGRSGPVKTALAAERTRVRARRRAQLRLAEAHLTEFRALRTRFAEAVTGAF